MRRIRSAPHHRKPSPSSQTTASSDYDADESDNDDLSSEYHHVALQLLDLMQTLHTRQFISLIVLNIFFWKITNSKQYLKCISFTVN